MVPISVTPNAIAHLALIGWPVVVALLFLRLPRGEAALWSIVAGYLLLPERLIYDLPLTPPWHKHSAPVFAALAVVLLLGDRRRGVGGAPLRWLPESRAGQALTLLFLFSPVMTVLTNGDTFVVGGRVLPGVSLYDAASTFYVQFIAVLPMLLARRYLADADARVTAVRVFAVATLAYSLPILLEARVSPQLHEWIYGYRPFDFAQQLRNDGFRPVVFLNHGLWTAVVTLLGLIAVASLWRTARGAARTFWMAATAWMGGVLLLSNSFGALLLGMAFAPLARFAPAALQATVAAGVGMAVLLYPMLRSIDVVPARELTELIRPIDDDRAASLLGRIIQEDMLLAHGNERALFGWGRYGRARVYDEETGEDLSVTDGRWVITFGEFGWAGYIGEYGLLSLPLILLAFNRRARQTSPVTVGLSLMLAVNLIDTIPNATLTPLTWLLAGAVLAQVEAARRRPSAPASDSSARRAARPARIFDPPPTPAMPTPGKRP